MSDILNLPNSLGNGVSPPLVIGIAGSIVTQDRNQNHSAIVYRGDDGKYYLAHLAWHYHFKHELWDGKYYWVELPGISEEVQETLADWIVLVASKAADIPIPYSIVFSPDRSFDAAGGYIDSNDGRGLTCATFILALLSDFGMPIADRTTWPTGRSEDQTWAIKILKYLYTEIHTKYPHLLPQFAKQWDQRMQLSRYRPEEVAACAYCYSGFPVSFDDASSIGRGIAEYIQENQ